MIWLEIAVSSYDCHAKCSRVVLNVWVGLLIVDKGELPRKNAASTSLLSLFAAGGRSSKNCGQNLVG